MSRWTTVGSLALLLSLAACGGGGGDGVNQLEGVWAPTFSGDGWVREDPTTYMETLSGRFGVYNGNLPVVTKVVVEDAFGAEVDEWDVAIGAGDLWECPEGTDLPDGTYQLWGACAIAPYGWVWRTFTKAPGQEAPILVGSMRVLFDPGAGVPGGGGGVTP